MRLSRKIYDTPADENIHLQNDLLDAKFISSQAQTYLYGSLTMTSCMVAILLGFIVLCVLLVIGLYIADNGELFGFILHHYWPAIFPPVYGW
jgi:hypothetical protein